MEEHNCIIYFYSIRGSSIQTIIVLMVVLSQAEETAKYLREWIVKLQTYVHTFSDDVAAWLKFRPEEVFKSFFTVLFLPD